MIIIDISYATCHLDNQTMAATLPGFHSINLSVQYLAIHPHKPIFYPSNSYDGSNVTRLTWIGNQVEDYTTRNCLEYNQYEDRARILNRRRSFSGILSTLLGVVV